VRISPGAIQLNLKPCGPSSVASNFVRPNNAVLDTPYNPSGGLRVERSV